MVNLPVTLLRAGACYRDNDTNSGNNDLLFVKCALDPAECKSILNASYYRSSRWLIENDTERATECASQSSIHHIPAMGRCAADMDNYICSSSPSACQLFQGWQAWDDGCTVVHDYTEQVYKYSYFGECLDRTSNDIDFCAWQSSECTPLESYRFQWANPFFANNLPDCQCDKVKTGACMLNNNYDYYCAVTEDVCATENDVNGDTWSYRKVLEVESELGVTCQLCDTLPTPPDVQVVAAGACINNSNTNKVEKCALTSAHCDSSSSSFLPASSILDPSQIDSTPDDAKVCASQKEGVQRIQVGRCNAQSNFFMCSPNAKACNVPQFFESNDPDCTVAQDNNQGLSSNVDFGSTYYGFCSTDDEAYGIFDAKTSTCVWSPLDCTPASSTASSMQYYDASPGTSASRPACRCDDVRTGACVSKKDPSIRYCAIDQGACSDDDNEWTFFNWQDLEMPPPIGQNLICHLCSKLTFNTNDNNNKSPPPNNGSPTSNNNNNNGSSLTTGAIAGIAIAVAVIVAALLTFVGFKYLPNNSKEKNDEVETNKKENQNNDHDEESSKDKDNQQQQEKASKEEANFVEEGMEMEPGQTEEDFIPQEDHSVN